METLEQNFRPGFWRIFVPLAIVSIVIVFLAVLLSTVAEGVYPWVADALGIFLGAYFLAATVLFLASLVTSLRLHSDGNSLTATYYVAGFGIFRHAIVGRTWHVIARPGRALGESEGIGSYRIEVTTTEGQRVSFLSPVLCWIFCIDCL